MHIEHAIAHILSTLSAISAQNWGTIASRCWRAYTLTSLSSSSSRLNEPAKRCQRRVFSKLEPLDSPALVVTAGTGILSPWYGVYAMEREYRGVEYREGGR